MFRNPLTDAIVVLIVLLLFFGPKRLPMLSRSIGESIKEFKGGINSSSKDDAPAIEKGETTPSQADERETAEAGAERRS